jgi:hypothetical protein
MSKKDRPTGQIRPVTAKVAFGPCFHEGESLYRVAQGVPAAYAIRHALNQIETIHALALTAAEDGRSPMLHAITTLAEFALATLESVDLGIERAGIAQV